jgi:hypothetical protein
MERFIEVVAAMMMCKAELHCGVNLCRDELVGPGSDGETVENTPYVKTAGIA